MCDLLGLCFNKLVDPIFSMKAFGQRGRGNNDGWGIAFYNNFGLIIKKDYHPAYNEQRSNNLAEYFEKVITNPHMKSHIFIGHVRKGSEPCYANTHPFFQFYHGKEWAFAHNGTIDKKILQEKLDEYKDQGIKIFEPNRGFNCAIDTDLFFSYILTWMNKNKIHSWSNLNDDQFQKCSNLLVKELISINESSDKITMNLIFSDGDFLFCYGDIRKYNQMRYIERPPYTFPIIAEEGGFNLDMKEQGEEGFIITAGNLRNNPNKPQLTNEKNWILFEPGQLLIIKKGLIKYN